MNKSLEQYMPDGSKLPYRFMKYRIHKDFLCFSIFFLINIQHPAENIKKAVKWIHLYGSLLHCLRI